MVRAAAASSSYGGASTSQQPSSTPHTDTRKRVVVVGGGWAGFGAAKHLSEQGYAVTLIEASKNPGGLSGGESVADCATAAHLPA